MVCISVAVFPMFLFPVPCFGVPKLLFYHRPPISFHIVMLNRTFCPSLCCFHTGPIPTPILATFPFHDVRDKTFSAHNTAEIVPLVRETGLFTHGRVDQFEKAVRSPLCLTRLSVQLFVVSIQALYLPTPDSCHVSFP